MAAQIRKHCVQLAHDNHAVHIGGSLSSSDILAVLFCDVMRYEPENPKWECRDRFIMSKGHSSSAYYSALSCSGFFPEAQLMTQYLDGSLLSGHVSHYVKGVEISTGSLGHGLPIACGIAMALKNKGKSCHVFVLMGDGECEEGTTWEASLFASKYKLDNLVAIIDNNSLQAGSSTKEVLGVDTDTISDMFRINGWSVTVIDGHDHSALYSAFQERSIIEKPRCIVAHTVKGKGVSFMENNPLYHYGKLNDDFYKQAMGEMEAAK